MQFRGRTGSYLEAAPGQPQLNVLKMAREGLASQLPLAIQRARQSDAAVRQGDVIVHERGHEQRIHLEVVPLRGEASARRHFLVVFELLPQFPYDTRWQEVSGLTVSTEFESWPEGGENRFVHQLPHNSEPSPPAS